MRKSSRQITLATLGCALLLTSGIVRAEDIGWHVGASIAQEYDQRASSFDRGDAQNARGLLAGLRFGNGWGVEVAYVDLGELDFGGALSGGFRADGELWSVGATYAWRIENVEPYARLGWFSRDESRRSTGLPVSPDRRSSDDGIAAEVGLRWFVTDPLAVRLGWAWYDFEPRQQGRAQLALEWHF